MSLDGYLYVMIDLEEYGVGDDNYQPLPCFVQFDSAVNTYLIVCLQLLREGSMRATFSYASILHAIGQVLDQIGVKSIAIHEEEDGLFVEGFNSEGQLQVQLRYDIASLYDLLHRSEEEVAEHSARDEGLLRRFLAGHSRELVGASL